MGDYSHTYDVYDMKVGIQDKLDGFSEVDRVIR